MKKVSNLIGWDAGVLLRKREFSPKNNGFLLWNCLVHGIDSCLNFSLYKMALAIVNFKTCG